MIPTERKAIIFFAISKGTIFSAGRNGFMFIMLGGRGQ